MPAKVIRKVLKSGDSKVAALPPDWLRAFQLDAGDTIEVLYNSVVLIKPKNFKLDVEFLTKELQIMARIEKGDSKEDAVGN